MMIASIKTRIPALLCICVPLFFSCLGNKTVKNDIIEHRISYTQRGTRSEALHGDLYIAGERVPDVFFLVISGSQGFEFFQRYHIWGRDGYIRVKYNIKNEFTRSDRSLPEDDLRKGYYTGNTRYINTPQTWLFVRWEGESAFVAPDRIYELIRDRDLRPIPRLAIIKGPLRKRKP